MTIHGAIPRGGYRQQPKRIPRSLGFARRTIFFDGVDDHIAIPHRASLSPVNGITIEVLVKPVSYTGTWNTLVRKGGIKPDITIAYGLWLKNNNEIYQEGLGIKGESIGAEVQLGVWQNIGLSYDKQNIKFYKNGVFVSQIPSTRSIASTTHNLRIGQSQFRNHEKLNAFVALCRIYIDYALDPDEMRWNTVNYHNPVRPDKLGLWLPMEEGVGEVVYDKSGHGNNGTLLPQGAGPTWERLRQWELRSAVE